VAVIEIDLDELYKLVGRNLSEEELKNILLNIKCELEEIKNKKAKIEVKDFYRIDLYSTAGLARELKGLLSIESGIPRYNVYDSDYKIFVDPKLSNIRPYIVGAVVKNVKLNDNLVKDIIQLQEKISTSFGRRRQKIAIGLHNFDLIKFPVFYKAVKPNEYKFTPLNYETELYLDEILEKTKAGQEYGYLIKDKEYYPLLLDSKNEVISMPPVINSNNIGKITTDSKNIFIDVSGTDLESLLITLNVIVTTLADYGGEIYSVRIIYSDKEIIAPKLEVIKREFDYFKIKKYLGIKIEDKEIIELLKKKRINAIIENDKMIIGYLNYRNDIISEYDIIEEILIAYGYNNIVPKVPNIYTKGKLSKRRKLINKIRDIMTNMKCIEIYTPVLSKKSINELLKEDKEIVEIINPVSSNYNSVRISLLTSFLQLLSESKEMRFPSKIFEVGRIAYLENNKIIEEDSVLYIYSNYKVTFSDAKSVLERLFIELNLEFKLVDSNYKYLISGRQGSIFINSEVVGWIGEINPEILEILDIKYPLVGFEISLTKLLKYYNDI